MATVGRNAAAPLLFLNLIMYFIVLGFASWCINRFINGQTAHPSMGGNGATGGHHIRSWRSDSLAAAGSSALIAWALTALAFRVIISSFLFLNLVNMIQGFAADLVEKENRRETSCKNGIPSMFACKHINIGGWRGWRLRILEAFIIILTFTQLLYVLLIHAGVFSSRYGPGYRDSDYGMHAPGDEPGHKTSTAVTGSRV
ncbi:hypothetical protein GOBAR_DD07819 [Gossypium barbadense]|nr:hypothetical protein GOBAR_DD07819 [Gossypium barbadense]